MVLKLEQFNLEGIATKNSMKLLRLFVLKPYSSWGLTELSEELSISKSNVLRIMKVLVKYNIVLQEKSARKKVYRINYELDLVGILWKLFMEEKRLNLNPRFKNVIDLLYHQVKDDLDLFILFGSVAQGLATEKSDIDICIVSKNHVKIKKFDFLPYRFEIHEYNWEDIIDPVDFVVLESLLNGVVFKGEIFKTIAETRSFLKAYLIYRLEKSKEFLSKAKGLKNEAKLYYNQMAEITVGEVKSLLLRGKTVPKKEINMENIENEIKALETKIADESERIWLI